MPIPTRLIGAADSLHMNTDVLIKSVSDLKDEEWFRRPNVSSNHLLWVVGHMIWARGSMVSRLGGEWSLPWVTKFTRGSKVEEDAAYPSPQEMVEAWRDVSTALTAVIQDIPEDLLTAPVQGVPSADGKMTGLIDFMAYHETYHMGQAAFLRSWLGHERLLG